MNKLVLGVDLGASYVRAGIVNKARTVLTFKKERSSTPQNLVKFLNSILLQNKTSAIFGCSGIGIGAPGL